MGPGPGNPKDSQALQGPEVGNIANPPAEPLRDCLSSQDPHRALCTERTQEPSLTNSQTTGSVLTPGPRPRPSPSCGQPEPG